MCAVVSVVASVLSTSPAQTVTWTGWFSDMECATPRVARGIIAPNGSDCVKRCLDKGVAAVFISEQAQALFQVKNFPSVKDEVGYHVELTGTIDEGANTITVQSVRRLEHVAEQCALPKKRKG